MMEEKGFFGRLKETLFGNEEENKSIEQIEIQAEELLKEEEDILEKIEQDTEIKAQEKKETKSETANIQAQKVSKEELEANEKNKSIIETLKTIEDPELGIDIWTLGLIYNITFNTEEKNVHILMTFTSIMCPVGPMIVQSVEQKIKQLPNIEKVHVEVVFAPPWEPTDELREMLGV